MKQALYLSLFGAVLLFAGACSNPADDAPAADVQEPAAEETTAAETNVEAVTYALSPDSKISFVGSKVTGSHDGGFNSFEGDVTVIGNDPTQSRVRVVIDTNSLWSDNDKLTEHLKSPDFFDVQTYPTATFSSTEITAGDTEGTYNVTGNLDLHGVTKAVTFPATIQVTEDGFSSQAEFSIKRFDFNIVYPGKTDDLIRDDVLIKLDLKSAPADDMMGETMGETMGDDMMGETMGDDMMDDGGESEQ